MSFQGCACALQVSDFKVGEQGQLKILRNKKTKEEVLAKFVEISSNEGIPRDLEREIVNHRQLLHPNIVRFYEVRSKLLPQVSSRASAGLYVAIPKCGT